MVGVMRLQGALVGRCPETPGALVGRCPETPGGTGW